MLGNIKIWALACSALLLTIVVLTSIPARAQSGQSITLADIERDISRVLDHAEMEPRARLTLARQARVAVREQRPDDARLNASACYAEAYALYLNGDTVHETLQPCFYSELRTQDLALYVSMTMLDAWLMLIHGNIEQSVAAYEALLDGDLSGLEDVMRLRLNGTYATALYQNDQPLAAIERFQLVLIEALELDAQEVVVAAGNNLVVVLIERHNYQSAQAWHERLQPTFASAPRSHYSDSFELHGLQLLGELDDPTAAAEKLGVFIEQRADAVPNIKGHAYEFMAGFLNLTGRYDEALAAATEAVDQLASLPLELAGARLALAEVLIARGDHEEALVELAKADALTGTAPAHIERVRALQLKARLGKLGPAGADIRTTFEQFQSLSGRRERQRMEQNTRYFDSVRELQLQQAELQRYELDRVRLESAAATNAVVANEQRALAQAERRARRLSITVLLLIAGAGIVIMVQQNRRRTDRELQRQAEQMNARLQQEVEEKSAAMRKQMGDQAALERSLAETRHNEVIGRITGNVAHDFNNLLQIISLSTERLSAKRTSDEDYSLFEGTRAALQHARSIIRQLLAYARRQKLKPSALRFDKYLNETEALFRVAVDDRIEFAVSDQSQDASIVIDSAQFTTILLNLLSNACAAMPSGGQLSLAARFESLTGGAPPWTNLASGDYLVIEVTDTGIGMNQRTLRRAFEPFFTDRAVGKGTGLGLSSVYGFVKQSRGDLRIDSEEGVGTTIMMVFPATRDLQPDTSEPVNDTVAFEGLRCLIVEDNEGLARALTSMFEARGASVAVAASAEAARARLRDDAPFDLVVSDVHMKGAHDGYELRDWLRGKYPKLPVLLMTGYVDDESRHSGVPSIHKPFTVTELTTAIKDLLASAPVLKPAVVEVN